MGQGGHVMQCRAAVDVEVLQAMQETVLLVPLFEVELQPTLFTVGLLQKWPVWCGMGACLIVMR